MMISTDNHSRQQKTRPPHQVDHQKPRPRASASLKKSLSRQSPSPRQRGVYAPVITPVTAPLSPLSQTSPPLSPVRRPSPSLTSTSASNSSAVISPNPPLTSATFKFSLPKHDLNQVSSGLNLNGVNAYQHTLRQPEQDWHRRQQQQDEIVDLLQILEAAGSVTSFGLNPSLLDEEDDMEEFSKQIMSKSARLLTDGHNEDDLITLGNLYRLSKSMASLRSESSFDLSEQMDSWWQDPNSTTEGDAILNQRQKKVGEEQDFLHLMMSQKELQEEPVCASQNDVKESRCPRRKSATAGPVIPMDPASRSLMSVNLQRDDHRTHTAEEPRWVVESSKSHPTTPRRNFDRTADYPKTCDGAYSRRIHDREEMQSHIPNRNVSRRKSFSDVSVPKKTQSKCDLQRRPSMNQGVVDDANDVHGERMAHLVTATSPIVSQGHILPRNHPRRRLSRSGSITHQSPSSILSRSPSFGDDTPQLSQPSQPSRDPANDHGVKCQGRIQRAKSFQSDLDQLERRACSHRPGLDTHSMLSDLSYSPPDSVHGLNKSRRLALLTTNNPELPQLAKTESSCAAKKVDRVTERGAVELPKRRSSVSADGPPKSGMRRSQSFQAELLQAFEVSAGGGTSPPEMTTAPRSASIISRRSSLKGEMSRKSLDHHNKKMSTPSTPQTRATRRSKSTDQIIVSAKNHELVISDTSRPVSPAPDKILKETGLTAKQLQKLMDAGFKVVAA